MNQAAGLAVSIGALGDHSGLNSTLQLLVTWTEHRLRRQNTSFDGKMVSRRSRFFK